MNLFIKFLRETAYLFTIGSLFDYFSDFPMSIEANFLISATLSLLLVIFTAYNERKENKKSK